ncbi:MAG TPA: signal peptidase II [bacterium]|nr:signal peptidase II [bacterium]
MSRLVPVGGTRVLIPHLLALTLVHNRGIAFGLLTRLSPGATMAIALTVLAVLFYNRTAWPAARAGQWGFGLIVGGALGNIFDRLRFGYVIDYVDVHVWPVFNLADAAIVVGAGALVAASLVGRRRG